MTGIAGWLGAHGERAALVFEGHRISYAELRARATALADGLQARGASRGDRIAVLEYNTPELLALVFACAMLRLVLVPLNWRLVPAEHDYQLGDSGARWLVIGDDFVTHGDALCSDCARIHFDELLGNVTGSADLPAPEAADPEDPLLIVYTSGTTGRPKGAVLSHRAMEANARVSVDAHELHAGDIVLTDLPLFHVGGLNIQTLPALSVGARVVLHRRFNPEHSLRDLSEHRVTVYLAVPATMQAMISHEHWKRTNLTSLRLMMAGSSVIPLHLIERFFDKRVTVGQVYGSTETAPTVIALGREDAKRHAGSCGKPALECDARIVMADGTQAPTGVSGEIEVRAPNLFSGYWNNPEATEACMRDGWYATGDIGHVDEDGFFFVDDRKHDVIISGGENIYPAEVEQVLAGVPGLAEWAVIGREDDRWGQLPVAVVVPRADVSLCSEDVLRAVEGQLARYKLPREVMFVDRLPRNAMGKVLRYRLREWLAETSRAQPNA